MAEGPDYVTSFPGGEGQGEGKRILLLIQATTAN